jgi:hypothetical protein
LFVHVFSRVVVCIVYPLALSVSLASCSGSRGAAPAPIPLLPAAGQRAASSAMSASNAAAKASGFNDYVTFGYDNARDVFNPNSTAITPSSLGKLHLAWQSAIGGGDFNVQSQPILATEIPKHAGMLFVGGGTGRVFGYDALTGAEVWTTSTGTMSYTYCGGDTSYFGIGGSAAYDPATKSLYIVGNKNASANAYGKNILYRLDAATGSILGQVDFTASAVGPTEQNFGHTSVTLRNGIAYVGTGSTCDVSSWRGRVVAVDVPAMTIAATFFTLWDPKDQRGKGAQPWGGGGVWGWGGVSLDPAGNVLTGIGNTDNGESSNGRIKPPFAAAPFEYSGYGESLLELAPYLGKVIADNHPIPKSTYNKVAVDLDVQGTPVVFSPSGPGCGTMVALQGKSGEFTVYDESDINSGFVAQYQLSPSTSSDGYLGDPAYSPVSGLMYAPVASSVQPTLFAPGLVAFDPGCGRPSVTWHTAFGSDSSGSGIPRSVPAPSAGGVVFAGSVKGSGGDLWAVDASTGSVLNGDWVFVLDVNGNLYGLTTDPAYPAIAPQTRPADPRARTRWPAPQG